MGGNSSREMMSPYAVNTPLIGICFTSLLFNSVQGGTLRSSNLYNNFILIYLLGISTGCSTVLQKPVLGAQLGFLASFCFTIGPNFRLLYTRRLFPDYVRYAIGTAYMTYHGLQWYREKTYFEDAMEDEEEN
ncbi:uncharacterized protein TM35_000171270 [Trypanosoma theileri]|uniref:Uncharacterized protein n=1 Tax=Trypanosoma theileri TaxID=67003 RepID=A0A1X0NU87_9TRYP|nr:uncharacterized protein TM35_000171270 [Trypanosoma theileri]ORC88255.1 hypothetical protein TM35_000171270 [Trypanosoma theileri]